MRWLNFKFRPMIKVLLYEDNANFAEGLKNILSLADGFECIGHFEHPQNAVQEVKDLQPDVILMDIEMPVKNGIEGLKDLREQNVQRPVIMLTTFEDDENIMQSIQAGANGYLLKESKPKKLLTALTDVMEGGAPMTSFVARRVLKLLSAQALEKDVVKNEAYNLSSREKEILKTLCDGLSYKMIATQLSISYHTVNNHIKKIYDKLHVHSSIEAVNKAAKERLV